jgi:hypothetical protein
MRARTHARAHARTPHHTRMRACAQTVLRAAALLPAGAPASAPGPVPVRRSFYGSTTLIMARWVVPRPRACGATSVPRYLPFPSLRAPRDCATVTRIPPAWLGVGAWQHGRRGGAQGSPSESVGFAPVGPGALAARQPAVSDRVRGRPSPPAFRDGIRAGHGIHAGTVSGPVFVPDGSGPTLSHQSESRPAYRLERSFKGARRIPRARTDAVAGRTFEFRSALGHGARTVALGPRHRFRVTACGNECVRSSFVKMSTFALCRRMCAVSLQFSWYLRQLQFPTTKYA